MALAPVEARVEWEPVALAELAVILEAREAQAVEPAAARADLVEAVEVVEAVELGGALALPAILAALVAAAG
ncbi:MAG: hypothetical protein ACJ78R_00415 [Gemmatimonadaceae bacterium]